MGRRPRPRYWVCPFLDETTGVCLVYDERLAVCRMHGYYAGRDGGRWCDRIEALATNPIGLVTLWGNYEAVCRELEALGGEPISLAQWLEECPTRSP